MIHRGCHVPGLGKFCTSWVEFSILRPGLVNQSQEKSKNKNVYIIIANGYTTKQHLEVSQSSYLTKGRKKRLRVCKHKAGEGLGAESHKTERDGSVSGAPCEMAVEDDGGRW
jgi:hypothetical protein